MLVPCFLSWRAPGVVELRECIKERFGGFEKQGSLVFPPGGRADDYPDYKGDWASVRIREARYKTGVLLIRNNKNILLKWMV